MALNMKQAAMCEIWLKIFVCFSIDFLKTFCEPFPKVKPQSVQTHYKKSKNFEANNGSLAKVHYLQFRPERFEKVSIK